jgi:hypothetical protein
MLRNAFAEHAERAPEGERMLSAVHTRSQQRRRRRRASLAAGFAVVFVAIGAPATVMALGGGRPAPGPADPGPSIAQASVEPSPDGSTSGSPSPTGSPSEPARSTTPPALRLAAPAFTTPTMPLQLPASTAGPFKQPVVTLQHGALVAYYAARDGERDADVTLVVTGQRPVFGTASAQVTEVGQRVRSRQGTLRTVAVRPAAQLVLYWQESATRWVQVRTDDTYTATEVAALADSLAGASMALEVPLRFDLAPVGMTLETVTPYAMAFQPGAGAGAVPGVVACTVVAQRQLSGATVQVGSYRATLARTAAGATLTVLVTDWNLTLLVEVPAGYDLPDADLIRFAAGVHVLNRAETREASADGIGAPIT